MSIPNDRIIEHRLKIVPRQSTMIPPMPEVSPEDVQAGADSIKSRFGNVAETLVRRHGTTIAFWGGLLTSVVSHGYEAKYGVGKSIMFDTFVGAGTWAGAVWLGKAGKIAAVPVNMAISARQFVKTLRDKDTVAVEINFNSVRGDSLEKILSLSRTATLSIIGSGMIAGGYWGYHAAARIVDRTSPITEPVAEPERPGNNSDYDPDDIARINNGIYIVRMVPRNG